MFIKVGFKTWTRGHQKGIRVYAPAIEHLVEFLNIPDFSGRWKSLAEFVSKVKRKGRTSRITPYSRKLKIKDYELKHELDATFTIAQHNSSTQGYITIPRGNWLYPIVEKNINKDFLVEYLKGEKEDLLILPHKFDLKQFNIEIQRKKEIENLERTVMKKLKRVPINLDKIGLFFEIQEVNYLKEQGYKPLHRYPYYESKDAELRRRKVVCDIDTFDQLGRFIKFVEVKSIYGHPPKEFILTFNEFNSRKKCKEKGWKYEIVIYYHIGKKIIKREVITESQDLKNKPFTYLCSTE